jgi:hypothetical protein
MAVLQFLCVFVQVSLWQEIVQTLQSARELGLVIICLQYRQQGNSKHVAETKALLSPRKDQPVAYHSGEKTN